MSTQIKHSINYIKAGVNPHTKHNKALKPWQRMLWKVTLWTWRLFILSLIAIAIYNLF
jgi:hypothetical protein